MLCLFFNPYLLEQADNPHDQWGEHQGGQEIAHADFFNFQQAADGNSEQQHPAGGSQFGHHRFAYNRIQLGRQQSDGSLIKQDHGG